MRKIPLYLAFLFLISCGSNEGTHPIADSDSVVNSSSYDSLAFLAARSSVSTMELPFLVTIDSLVRFPTFSIDQRAANDLLPGEFDYESYTNVYCFADSKIGVKPLLWFRLESKSDYEDAPDNVDVITVLYDCDYRPIDVYNVASSNLGYSFSFVRTDSIFTVELDEMENINVTTTALAITETGFVPESSETKSFGTKKTDYELSRAYLADYLASHGLTKLSND